MSKPRVHLHIASLALVLLAGSCAAPFSDNSAPPFEDGAVNHPITVEPSYRSLKLPFSATDAGLLPSDDEHFADFVAHYLAHGNGSISIAAPRNADGASAIGYFGERLERMGVPRAHIIVGEVSGPDNRVELGYMTYEANVEPCGDWSKDLGDTSENGTAPDFGCSVQHNIAAMVANPRDLVEPRREEGSDAARRASVITHYEKGEPTATSKSKDQTGAVSDINR
jgi:pilus assembly protein CpaD